VCFARLDMRFVYWFFVQSNGVWMQYGCGRGDKRDYC